MVNSVAEAARVDVSPNWHEDFYASVDWVNITFIDRLCTPDTIVRMGDHPGALGREAVKTGLGHFWSAIVGLHHTFANLIEDGDRTLLEADRECTRKDGSKVTIPVETGIDPRDGLVASQRIYIDAAPLCA